MNRKRAFTLIELLVVMAIIALLIALLLPALNNARRQAQLLQDGTQIEQIHQAWATFAPSNKGKFPTPGLARRLQFNGQYIPGRGQEDLEANTTTNVHSYSVMQNLYGVTLLVGPTEVNPNVVVAERYNFDVYSQTADPPVYWDDAPIRFDGRLNGGGFCAFSYASVPVAGTRKSQQWRDSMDSAFAMIGNRGAYQGELVERSLTFQLHGGARQWNGNVCFNDNHISVLDTFFPEGINYDDGAGTSVPDNLFRNQACDSGAGSCPPDGVEGYDSFLAIISELDYNGTEAIGTAEWDEIP